MEKINFRKDKIPFTQIANEVLNDKNLSAKAKGIYAYLYSKPEGWDFAIDRIQIDFADSRFAINSGLKELEQNGYLIRERQKTGRVVYLLKSQMTKIDIGQLEEKPNANYCKVQKLQSAKTSTISNKDIKVIKNNIYIGILNHWNSKDIVNHKETKIILRDIEKALSNYDLSEIQQSIDNYAEIFNSEDTYFKYKWTLSEFLNRKNALPVFIHKKVEDYLISSIPKTKAYKNKNSDSMVEKIKAKNNLN